MRADVDSLTADQLRAAIARSGLSQVRFAREVLVRDPRTIRRWLAGDRAIPEAVLRFLATYRPRRGHA